jgi:hypothetical protein
MCLKFKVGPDLHMFNLMLKAAHDCNLSGVSLSPKKKTALTKFVFNNRHKKPAFQPIESANLFPRNTLEFNEFNVDEDLESLRQVDTNETNETQEEKDLKIKNLTDGITDKLDNINMKESNDELFIVKKEETEVIDEMKLAATALKEQISKLEWWQDIKTNIDRDQLKKAVTQLKQPGLKNLFEESNHEEVVLVKVYDQKTVEELIERVLSEETDDALSRLNMLGGLNGVFDALAKFRVKPDHKLFNILVRSIRNDLESEEDLLSRIKEIGCRPDTDFINFLINKRILRGQKAQADVTKIFVTIYFDIDSFEKKNTKNIFND